jgi:hypothetical protein
MIITPTSLSINQLFSSTNEQYVIPTYQRRYSWHERQVWELIDDILLIEDGDTHLLGSIVCLAGHHTAGLNKLELVDGQQRLTTITILLECIRQRLELEGESEDAAEVGRLLSAKPLGGKPLRKVALDSIDSAEFDHLVENDQEQVYPNQQLFSAFNIIRGWIGDQSLEKIGTFLYRLQNQTIVIRLDVSEAKDAFKLFETINNRGLRLSPTDIIKNFLLGNAARFSQTALQSARNSWAELIVHLDGTDTDAFFRYYLMALVQTRITASEVVPHFKKVFMTQVKEAAALPERHLYADVDEPDDEESDDVSDSSTSEIVTSSLGQVSFKNFLAKLIHSAKVYGELVLVKTSDARSNRHLRNLRMIKAVQTYGFLMHLRVGGCSDKQFREVLKLTESFVLRRHVCRERSNETEALFARMCGIDPADPVKPTKVAYRGLCPSDDKFLEEFASTNFSASLIDRARYCLEQIEIAKHGDHDELQVLGPDDVHVEHIIPQKIKTKRAKDEFGDWVAYLGDKAETLHPRYVSRIGNLTIFSGTLNIGASNNPFLKKKQAYKDSAIKLTQELLKLSQFKFKNVEQRSSELAKIAVELWPQP